MNEQTSEWIKKSEWLNKQVKEWKTNKWMNEWINEQTSEWTKEIKVSFPFCQIERQTEK